MNYLNKSLLSLRLKVAILEAEKLEADTSRVVMTLKLANRGVYVTEYVLKKVELLEWVDFLSLLADFLKLHVVNILTTK